jgi:hypothetical protein
LHGSTSTVGQWLERDLAGKPGPTFPDHAQNLEFEGRQAPKKEARPKGPGTTLLVAAQYSQKSPENNGLFGHCRTICLREVIANRWILPDIAARK